MAKLVTIFGGSGFVGRYIARRMAYDGWRVRVAVRNPNEAGFVRTYGAVGQVEPILCNIRDEASVAAALSGADVAINCVGILCEARKNTFGAVQVEGAERIARNAAQQGVARLVHISAIGADADAESEYSRTKAAGEAAILDAFPAAVILRPSIIFGAEDEFFNRFADMTRVSPIIPVVGANTRFQPVYVDDVAQAAQVAAEGNASGIYELGGPDVESFRALMQRMLGVVRRKRLVVGMPFWKARIFGALNDFARWASFGLVPAMITRDQVASLRHDNVVSDDAQTLSDLGITPVGMDAILPDYLWRFRPDGQYNELARSGKDLNA